MKEGNQSAESERWAAVYNALSSSTHTALEIPYMNRTVVIVVAVGVLCLAAVCVALGVNLLPSRVEAGERGTFAAWALTWIMIWMTTAAALVLSGYLAMTAATGRT